MTTNASGNATYSDFYPSGSGTHNLLVNVFTSAAGLSDPKHREISTVDAVVTVP